MARHGLAGRGFALQCKDLKKSNMFLEDVCKILLL